MKGLLSLLGLDIYLRRLRIAAGEGALAAEDRAQLLRFVWEEESHRLRWVLSLVIAVVGLTIVTLALLSVAVVVHFWDTPERAPAAWSVAGVWLALWFVAVVGLRGLLRSSPAGMVAARREFARDWRWVQAQIGARERGPGHREPRPATREELLARMERQRERIAQLQMASFHQATMAVDIPKESLSTTAVRVVREHPVATAAVVTGAVVVIGPRRLARVAAWIVPIIWRMR